MTTIDPTSPTNSTFDPLSDPNALTGDALLVYCRSQLNSYDSDINSFLNEQRLALARKKALGSIENTMKKFTETLDATGQQECLTTWNAAINSLPQGDPMRVQMEKEFAKFQAQTQTAGGFSKEQWAGYLGDVHSMIDDVSGSAEINMIQLQSIMSQRQTAVQLTTSMLAKFDEGVKSVVSNIGR